MTLAAIDGSEQSMHATDFAISIATKYEAELIALYVFYSEIGYAYASYLSKVEDSPSMAAILDSAKHEANQWSKHKWDVMIGLNSLKFILMAI